jgi:predicted dehydrogenase
VHSAEPLRVGLVGVGVGASQLLPALTSSPHVQLIAAADVRPAALDQPHGRDSADTEGHDTPLLRSANSLGLFGPTLVTCERGDLRESPAGLYLYQHGAVQPIPIADELRGAAELEELYQAVRYAKPIVHDGRWGQATLEVCLAIVESARTHADVRLSHQTALPT